MIAPAESHSLAVRFRAKEARLRFGIIALADFTLSALSMFLDPIRLAADEGDRSRQIAFAWDIFTMSGKPVRSSSGTVISPTAPIGAIERADYVVVVGGRIPRGSFPSHTLSELLRRCDRKGKRLVGLCTGAFVLAEARLLSDGICSVSWFHRQEFEAMFDTTRPDTLSQFHRSGRHFTCAGGLGAAYLSLAIIHAELSEEAARKSASILLIPYERMQDDQPALSVNGVRSQLLRQAIRIFEQTLEESVSMADVAARLRVSRRQLERAFRHELDRTALDVRDELRIRRAKQLLNGTDQPLIEVAVSCGYGSTSTMNRVFKRHREALPRDIRAAIARPGTDSSF